MQGSGVRRSRSGVRDGKVIARLEEFAGACAQARPDHRADPPASCLGACRIKQSSCRGRKVERQCSRMRPPKCHKSWSVSCSFIQSGCHAYAIYKSAIHC